MQDIIDLTSQTLGLEEDSLSTVQMMLRTAIVYFVALAMVRLGEKRFLGKNTAFDVILGVMLGSLVSRAITNPEHFHQIFGAGFIFVGLHWLMAAIAFHSDWLGTLFKGSERKLIEDGRIDWRAMRKSHISRKDLAGALRRNGRLDDPEQVEAAFLERSGDISVLKKDEAPRILEVAVEPGVQTIRIKLE